MYEIYRAVETRILETEGAVVCCLAKAHVDRSFGVFDASRKNHATCRCDAIAVCLQKKNKNNDVMYKPTKIN